MHPSPSSSNTFTEYFHLYEPEHKFELPEDIDEQWIGITVTLVKI